MKAIVVPVSLQEKLKLIDLGESELDTYYKYIGCDCIDIVSLYGDGRYTVDCIVDDNGLLNDSPINEYWTRAYHCGRANYELAGITVICMTDRNTGDTCELNMDYVKSILKDIYAFTDEDFQFQEVAVMSENQRTELRIAALIEALQEELQGLRPAEDDSYDIDVIIEDIYSLEIIKNRYCEAV